jgi:DNA invertase Pin-like site-specific DNA recombinase
MVQSLDAERGALLAAGATKIFAETISGTVTDRKQLGRAFKVLAPGDTLPVSRLDRLARSTRDLLNILDAVGKAGATFRSLAHAWADTTTAHGRLMLTVLGGLAQFERELLVADWRRPQTRYGEGYPIWPQAEVDVLPDR